VITEKEDVMRCYDGKVAIVTGAASGVGKALSGQLAARGARVVASDVNGTMLDAVQGSMGDRGLEVRTMPLDVADFKAVKRMVEETVTEQGRLDYLFNNAGIGVGGEAYDYGYEDWKDVLDVNLYGVVNGVQAAYPLMVKQGFGHIVNTASLAGLIPMVGEISYVASKYAVVGLSHTLRAEAAALGVKVTAVCPGKIETPIWETGKVIKYHREKLLAMLPRGITPEACASIILRGVARNKATIVVTPMAKILWLIHRVSPNLLLWLATQHMKKVRICRIDGS